jgi:hypothetical protein
MVLICGKDSPLTIEQFHKNRCREKEEVKAILIDRKYKKDTYNGDEAKEGTPVPMNNSYSKSIGQENSAAMKLSAYNCRRR